MQRGSGRAVLREWPDGARQGHRGYSSSGCGRTAPTRRLSDKVSLLKGLTEIEGEVAGQNRFLDTMGGGLEMVSADSTMAASSMSAQGGARFGLCVAGAVVVFFFCLRRG